jgi:hypothetical protein
MSFDLATHVQALQRDGALHGYRLSTARRK